MSEVKRYEWAAKSSSGVEMEDSPLGPWVKYDDYARLDAELEEAREATDVLLHHVETVVHESARPMSVIYQLALRVRAALEGKR